MAYSQEQKYWIWLSSVYGLGAKRFDALLEKIGEPQCVWEETGPHLRPVLGEAVFQALLQARNAAYFDRLFDSIERCQAIAITRNDAEYPALLRSIPDSPPTLFVRGRAALSEDRALAIVGARNCTAYGTRMARRISRELSLAGVTIISGLARGIDSAAHRGAIDSKARTVAVLGSGVDVIYPPEHQVLSDEILANGGSIVSEFLPGAPPNSFHFPARNRIISGLSQGLLLVEAGKRSGAMTTVAYATEHNRDIFAVPGQADSPLSAATNGLLRDGARLATAASDIFEDMGWGLPGKIRQDGSHRVTAVLPLTQAEQRVYNALAAGPMDTDAMVEYLRVAPPELNSLLTTLELQGLIRKLPGRKVERAADMEE